MRKTFERLLAPAMIFLMVVAFTPGISSARPIAPEEDAADSLAAAKEPDRSLRFEQWLILGPVPTPLPAFHLEEKEDNDGNFLLSFADMQIEGFLPVPGAQENLPGGTRALWSTVTADTGGVILPSPAAFPCITYLASYIEIPRWMKVELEARSTDPFEMFIDGKSVIKSTKGTGTGKTGDPKSGSVNLKQGKHLVVIKTVSVPGDSVVAWLFDASIKANKDFEEDPVVTLNLSGPLNISHILDVDNIGNIDVSPDGRLVLISYWKFLPPGGKRENWKEIRSLPDGKLVHSIHESNMKNVEWAPSGNHLSYTVQANTKGSIRVLDLDTGFTETIVEGVKKLGGYTWSPDGTYIVYYVNEDDKKDDSGIKRLRSIQDRTKYARNRTSVFLASVPGGTVRKLATGKYDVFVSDIHPDGKKMLVQRSYENLHERPFSSTELFILDLEDMSTELLWKGHWIRNATWSPDGKKILISGGPSTFGETGRNIPDGLIPNDYDGQLFIFDPISKTAEAITIDFDPAVREATWSKVDGNIYIVAETGSYVRCYRYDPKKKKFRKFDFGVDVIKSGDISENRLAFVFSASGADQPAKIYYADLKRGKARELVFPGREMLEHVRLGKIENWDFTSEQGRTIVGRVHYPPDFDPDRKYPCIVYYYGGTSPVNRAFGGRYPKNLWAAKGYIIYVLQPSGATGFGQEFSTAHVNDWGKVTADEIIYGTRKFLETHLFVNPYRVGCIGASYGGFMTQLLITRTDLFAAAVSHAGISMIPSYWGEGYWGYAYNAVSAAGSYPWNRPDIYVGQSPLFAADRITTPLLLLHGASDTNVPPGESEQMYTALKILGKEVEYIKYAGQNHFILDYKKRTAWSDAQLSWFDKWLKDEPEWWDELYPPLGGDEKKEPEKMEAHRIELKDDYIVLLGEVTRQDIITNLEAWDSEYFEFEPDEETLSRLREKIFAVEITCVLGTWCSDSQREIPRLWKILEKLEYPVSEIRMLAVGSSRFTIDMPIPARVFKWSRDIRSSFDIERVATIIISRNGEETGRIVETPEESLEKDLLKIISSE